MEDKVVDEAELGDDSGWGVRLWSSGRLWLRGELGVERCVAGVGVVGRYVLGGAGVSSSSLTGWLPPVPGNQPVKSSRILQVDVCLLRSSAIASMRSASGVNTLVSLYPFSRRRSSRHSSVLDVPRRCKGTRPGSPRDKAAG